MYCAVIKPNMLYFGPQLRAAVLGLRQLLIDDVNIYYILSSIFFILYYILARSYVLQCWVYGNSFENSLVVVVVPNRDPVIYIYIYFRTLLDW